MSDTLEDADDSQVPGQEPKQIYTEDEIIENR